MPLDPVAEYKRKYLTKKVADTATDVPASDPVTAYKKKYLNGSKKPDAIDQAKGGVAQVAGVFRHPVEAAKGIAKGIYKSGKDALSPVKGEPVGRVTNTILGDDIQTRPTGREQVNKRGVTREEKNLGVVNTAANAGFAVAPALALPARVAVNAGLGALNDKEQRIRGAVTGGILGEVLHGAPKVTKKVGNVGDVSAGVMEAAFDDAARTTKGTSPSSIMGRPPERGTAADIALNNPRSARARLATPVEIKPKGKAKSEPAKATKAGIITESGAIVGKKKRAGILGQLDQQPESVKLVAPDGEPVTSPAKALRTFEQTFDVEGKPRRVPLEERGVRRRVAAEIDETSAEPPPESVDTAPVRTPIGRQLDVDSPPKGEAISFPPIEPSDITPVVSANGEFQARPGVMQRVNRELAGKGTIEPSATLPRIKPEDFESRDPTITVEEANRRIEAARKEGEAKAKPAKVNPIDEKEPETGLYLNSRNNSGKLRPFHTVSTDALMREAIELETKRAAAGERAIYRSVESDGASDTAFSVIQAATRGSDGVSMQAKALQNLRDFERIQKQIDAELVKRGLSPDDIYAKQREIAEADAAFDREAEEFNGDALERELYGAESPTNEVPTNTKSIVEPELDDSFDFGSNVEDVPDPVTQPREYLNYAKFGLDRATEARVRDAVNKGRAEGTVDKGRKTFGEQDAEAREFAKKLVANPLDIDASKLKNLSGAEVVGLHHVVGENTRIAEAASRAINSGELSAAELADTQAMFDRAMKSTNEALSAIVREKAQTARDLGYFRQIAKQSTDADVWLVHAKKVLGDRPMPDNVMLEIRRLANEAAAVCGGG